MDKLISFENKKGKKPMMSSGKRAEKKCGYCADSSRYLKISDAVTENEEQRLRVIMVFYKKFLLGVFIKKTGYTKIRGRAQRFQKLG